MSIKRIAAQLLREFVGPAVIAASWVAYGALVDGVIASFAEGVTRFGATFFFVAWLTGQVFRVIKQTRTESSFELLEQRVGDVLGSLEREAAELKHFATGGASFAVAAINIGSINRSSVVISHHGLYPLYNVSARIVDINALNNLAPPITYEMVRSADVTLDLGDLTPGYAAIGGDLQPVNSTSKDYNIFFTARNGGWTQQIRARLINGVWVQASCTTRELANEEDYVLAAKRDETFPDSDLPSNWPADGREVVPQ